MIDGWWQQVTTHPNNAMQFFAWCHNFEQMPAVCCIISSNILSSHTCIYPAFQPAGFLKKDVGYHRVALTIKGILGGLLLFWWLSFVCSLYNVPCNITHGSWIDLRDGIYTVCISLVSQVDPWGYVRDRAWLQLLWTTYLLPIQFESYAVQSFDGIDQMTSHKECVGINWAIRHSNILDRNNSSYNELHGYSIRVKKMLSISAPVVQQSSSAANIFMYIKSDCSCIIMASRIFDWLWSYELMVHYDTYGWWCSYWCMLRVNIVKVLRLNLILNEIRYRRSSCIMPNSHPQTKTCVDFRIP